MKHDTDPGEHYLGMRPGDLEGKPYARFWNPEMQPPQEAVTRALLHGPEASELGFSMDEADLLNRPGYLPLETGTTTLESGQLFVAALTGMPGVTGEMFEWWMGWHTMEHQRYKLWHPRAHVANGTKEMQGDDPDRSNREKYMTTHYVTEYIGRQLERITITFLEPASLFTRVPEPGEDGVTAVVFGKVARQNAPVTIGYLVHQIREVEGGSEMRSRFWLGKPELGDLARDHWINRVLGSRLIAGRLATRSLARDMLVHCGMEMNHLAGFLPALYADYHR